MFYLLLFTLVSITAVIFYNTGYSAGSAKRPSVEHNFKYTPTTDYKTVVDQLTAIIQKHNLQLPDEKPKTLYSDEMWTKDVKRGLKSLRTFLAESVGPDNKLISLEMHYHCTTRDVKESEKWKFVKSFKGQNWINAECVMEGEFERLLLRHKDYKDGISYFFKAEFEPRFNPASVKIELESIKVPTYTFLTKDDVDFFKAVREIERGEATIDANDFTEKVRLQFLKRQTEVKT